jgi:hypothetical protein
LNRNSSALIINYTTQLQQQEASVFHGRPTMINWSDAVALDVKSDQCFNYWQIEKATCLVLADIEGRV